MVGPERVVHHVQTPPRQSVWVGIGVAPGVPTVPSYLAIAEQRQDRLLITWSDYAWNDSGFRIYGWNGASWVLRGQVGPNATTFGDGELACGTTYDYQIRSYNSVGESAERMSSGRTLPCVHVIYIPLLRH